MLLLLTGGMGSRFAGAAGPPGQPPPPLTPAQIEALATAQDDTEVPDEAFALLVTHLSDSHDSNESIHLRVAADQLLASPQLTRGDLYRIEGTLVQRSLMPVPYRDIDEWFIRTADGTPLVVYLQHEDANDAMGEGQPIRVDARFYKIARARDRQGQWQRYPAFLGGVPAPIMAGAARRFNGQDILMMLGLLLMLVVILVVVMACARRQPRAMSRLRAPGGSSPVELPPSMTDDPAQALRQLQEHAQGERS